MMTTQRWCPVDIGAPPETAQVFLVEKCQQVDVHNCVEHCDAQACNSEYQGCHNRPQGCVSPAHATVAHGLRRLKACRACDTPNASQAAGEMITSAAHQRPIVHHEPEQHNACKPTPTHKQPTSGFELAAKAANTHCA